MKINTKLHKLYNIKNYLIKNKFLFFCESSHKSSKKLLDMKKILKNLNISSLKIVNKTFKKSFENSTKYFTRHLVSGSVFLTKLNKSKFITKTTLISSFHSLFMFILAFKLNNKFYSVSKIKNLYFLNYLQSKQFLAQSCILKLKQNFKIQD